MPQEVKPAFLPQSQNRNTGFFNFGGGGGAGGGGFSGILGSAIKTFADEGINMAKELAFGPTEQELAAQLANRDTQYTGAKQGFSKGLSVDQVKALYPDLEDDQLAALANDVQIQTLGYQAGKQKDDLQAAQSQRQKVKMAPVVAGGSAAGSAIGEQVSAPVSAESKANVAQMEDTQTGLDKSLEYAPSETTDLISPTGEPMGMGTNQIADQTSSIVFSGDPAHPEFQTAMGEISNRLKESPDRVKLASSADANLADYLDFRLQTSQMRNHDMYTAVFNKSFTPDNNIAAYDARDAVDLEVWGNYLDTKLSALGIVPDLVAQAPFAPMVEFISQQNNPANLQTLEATAISMKQMAETPEQEAEAQKMLDSVDESRRRAEEGRKYIASLNGRDAAQTIAFFSSKPFSDIAMGKNSNASVNQLARIATNWQTIQGRKAVAEMQEGHPERHPGSDGR
jgi:hypothetical protein